MRKVIKAIFALAVMAAASLALAYWNMYPAGAATEPVEPVCATWQLRGATGAYPDVEFGPAPDGSHISGPDEVVLTKPEGGVDPGVEFATRDIDLTLESGTEVSVSYELSSGAFPASTAAGAVRMFGYEDAAANTVTDAPDWKDVAEADSGVLVFTVPAGKTIGILGLVYDASNNAQGHITFSDMAIGGRPVSWVPCPEPTSSASPTASPDPSSTANPTELPTDPVPTGTDDPGTLPVTGSSFPAGAIAAGGIGAVALGILALILATRRGRES